MIICDICGAKIPKEQHPVIDHILEEHWCTDCAVEASTLNAKITDEFRAKRAEAWRIGLKKIRAARKDMNLKSHG